MLVVNYDSGNHLPSSLQNSAPSDRNSVTRDGGMLARCHTVSSQVVKLGRCPKSPLSHSTFPNTPNFGIYTNEFSRLLLIKGIPRRGAISLCQNLCPNFGFKTK